MSKGVFTNDILKMLVFSRYDQNDAAIAFAKGFGLKRGAIASSVAHDSHNIIAVGCNDEDLLATNQYIYSTLLHSSFASATTGLHNHAKRLRIMRPQQKNRPEHLNAFLVTINRWVVVKAKPRCTGLKKINQKRALFCG